MRRWLVLAALLGMGVLSQACRRKSAEAVVEPPRFARYLPLSVRVAGTITDRNLTNFTGTEQLFSLSQMQRLLQVTGLKPEDISQLLSCGDGTAVALLISTESASSVMQRLRAANRSPGAAPSADVLESRAMCEVATDPVWRWFQVDEATLLAGVEPLFGEMLEVLQGRAPSLASGRPDLQRLWRQLTPGDQHALVIPRPPKERRKGDLDQIDPVLGWIFERTEAVQALAGSLSYAPEGGEIQSLSLQTGGRFDATKVAAVLRLYVEVLKRTSSRSKPERHQLVTEDDVVTLQLHFSPEAIEVRNQRMAADTEKAERISAKRQQLLELASSGASLTGKWSSRGSTGPVALQFKPISEGGRLLLYAWVIDPNQPASGRRFSGKLKMPSALNSPEPWMEFVSGAETNSTENFPAGTDNALNRFLARTQPRTFELRATPTDLEGRNPEATILRGTESLDFKFPLKSSSGR